MLAPAYSYPVKNQAYECEWGALPACRPLSGAGAQLEAYLATCRLQVSNIEKFKTGTHNCAGHARRAVTGRIDFFSPKLGIPNRLGVPCDLAKWHLLPLHALSDYFQLLTALFVSSAQHPRDIVPVHERITNETFHEYPRDSAATEVRRSTACVRQATTHKLNLSVHFKNIPTAFLTTSASSRRKHIRLRTPICNSSMLP